MNNETTSIHFDTLDRLCELLDCKPGDILVKKEDDSEKEEKKRRKQQYKSK